MLQFIAATSSKSLIGSTHLHLNWTTEKQLFAIDKSYMNLELPALVTLEALKAFMSTS